MMRCSQCHGPAHTRSSCEMSITTKERYYQCQNINCGHTFVCHETFIRSISVPNNVNHVPAHPTTNDSQCALPM